ncbi:MAG: TetR/AcrR family transcriptional regulator, partial [Afipia sp.]
MPRTATLASGTGRNSGRQSGKERISNAAMLLFARMPYCDTSLRDIAAAAEVDVAYVHRSFGSKAEIFRHALAALDP